MVGIPDVTISATDVVVNVNINSVGQNAPVVDYATHHLNVSTGAAPVALSMAGSHGYYTLVSATLNIDLGTVAELSGQFAVQTQSNQQVTLSDGTTATVNELTFGGSNVAVLRA